MEAEPLVSVVTPCLDPGERLRRCLESVAAQSYRRIEHVVVDGGSTDGTVERLRDAPVKFVSEPDRGQTDALNKGFALASGDLVGWLNADDELTPGAVEAVVAAFRKRPDAGWVYGDCEVRRGGGRVLVWRPPRRIDLRALDLGDVLPQPGSFVARRALERVLPLDESFHLAMDFDLWLRLADAGFDGVYVPKTLAVFELHAESKTGSQARAAFFAEEERALLKLGRVRPAAFARGRAAAAAAALAGSSLDSEIEDAARREPTLPEQPIRAGALAEAAMIGIHSSPAALRHLLRPEPWRYRETRVRIRAGVRRGAGRILGRVRAGGHASR